MASRFVVPPSFIPLGWIIPARQDSENLLFCRARHLFGSIANSTDEALLRGKGCTLTASEEGRSFVVAISVFICSQSALNLASELPLPGWGLLVLFDERHRFLIEHSSADNAPLVIWNALTQKRRIVVNVLNISSISGFSSP